MDGCEWQSHGVRSVAQARHRERQLRAHGMPYTRLDAQGLARVSCLTKYVRHPNNSCWCDDGTLHRGLDLSFLTLHRTNPCLSRGQGPGSVPSGECAIPGAPCL